LSNHNRERKFGRPPLECSFFAIVFRPVRVKGICRASRPLDMSI